MKNDQPKNIEELMVLLGQEKGIAIAGAQQTQALRMMGYYHGYKGYRTSARRETGSPIPVLKNWLPSMTLMRS